MSIQEIVNGTFGLLFTFWPFLFVSALPKRGNPIRPLLVVWVCCACIRAILLLTSPEAPPAFIIPEPLSTHLFLLTGLVLSGIWVVARRFQHRHLWHLIDRSASVGDLHGVSPAEFEDMVVEWYTTLGHQARRVGGQGDHGVDVMVYTAGGEKWIVQCKRWKGNVGEPTVRDFYGALHHEGADRGAIITAGKFTPQARSWARGKSIDLYEGHEFLDRLRRARAMRRKAMGVEVVQRSNRAPLCPQCGVPMVVRVAKRGKHQGEQLYGCTNYPRCGQIIPIHDDVAVSDQR